MTSEKERRKNLLIKIGSRCRDYRHALRLTMADVSEQTGYSIAQISKFERGLTDSAVMLTMYSTLTFKEAKK